MRESNTVSIGSLVATSALAVSLSACPPTPMMTGNCPTGGTPTTHQGAITADETWGAGIHTVTATVEVPTGRALTISPCADVRLDPAVSIVVDADSRGLTAHGTSMQPIRFSRNGSSAWGAITVRAPATVDLAYATLEGGGGADHLGASLVAIGEAATPSASLGVDHVTVQRSTGLGLFMQRTDFTAASNALTVTGSGTQPVYLGAQWATNLPTGTYTGNGKDEFLLQSSTAAGDANNDPIIRDATIRNRGIPYRVGAEGTGGTAIVVGDGRSETPGSTLTIEAGVTLRFERQTSGESSVRVRAHRGIDGVTNVPQGVLIAHGTSDDPITFTSAAAVPVAGDWLGLYFEYIVDPNTSISHAVIQYGGGESASNHICPSTPQNTNGDADCSVVMFLDDMSAPAIGFITESSIEHAHCGIYRGWHNTPTDFLATNHFFGIDGCLQTSVPNDQNQCVMCPTM